MKNKKEITINIPNERILKLLTSTPAFNTLSRLSLKVGDNIEIVNHKQFSDMTRLYPIIGVEVNEN